MLVKELGNNKISHGLRPREIPQSSPASPWETPLGLPPFTRIYPFWEISSKFMFSSPTNTIKIRKFCKGLIFN